MKKTHHILGGGTIFHVRPHLALSAPAYGKTAALIGEILTNWYPDEPSKLHLTRMAGGPSHLETNADVAKLIDGLIADKETGIIFMSAALCDFEGRIQAEKFEGVSGPPYLSTTLEPSGKDQPRLKTGDGDRLLRLTPADKLISRIRKERKDIFLVGFKTTAGATADEQYMAGLRLLKSSSCNLVLANDVHTRRNMVITPEQARYHETEDRFTAIKGLVDMALLRSKLTFTRANVQPGKFVPWTDDRIPANLRAVVEHCIKRGAYKPFQGATVGHFAAKVDGRVFITSRRKTDFNKLPETGMVLCESLGPGSVVAFGGKPSVGGQSQRIIFNEHPDVDCIVHFHCPTKPTSEVPRRSQREYECGSHECGKNTSNGLKKFGGVYAVMLDQHGPNVVFNKNTEPQEVIRFIEDNFDLTDRTDGVKDWQAWA